MTVAVAPDTYLQYFEAGVDPRTVRRFVGPAGRNLTMKYIFQYPDVHGRDADMLDSGSIPEVAIAAEAAGWSGIAFTEHPIPSVRWLDSGGHQALDPFVALSYASAVTTRLRLLTYLAVAPYRNPFLLAKSAATVDKLSGGRLILGMGTGYLKAEFHALGVDFDTRNDRFDEVLDILPRYWSGEPFSYQGAHFSARDVVALPRPVQDPIPVWIGGNSRLTVKRVAARGQGWMPMSGPPQLFATARTAAIGGILELSERIAELKELAGERAGEIDVAVSYTVADTRAAIDDPGPHRDALTALEETGATWCVVAGSAAPARDTLRYIEGFLPT